MFFGACRFALLKRRLRHMSRRLLLGMVLLAAAPMAVAEVDLDKSCASLQDRFAGVIADVMPPDVEAAFLKRALDEARGEREATKVRDVALCAFLVATWDVQVSQHYGAFIASLPEPKRAAAEAVIFKVCLQEQVTDQLAIPHAAAAGNGENSLAAIPAQEATVRVQLAGVLSSELLVSYDRAMADVDRLREVNGALQMLQGLDADHVLDDAARQKIAEAVGERRVKVWRALKDADRKSVDFAAEMARADADALQYLHTILPDNEYKIARDLWGPATSASTH